MPRVAQRDLVHRLGVWASYGRLIWPAKVPGSTLSLNRRLELNQLAANSVSAREANPLVRAEWQYPPPLRNAVLHVRLSRRRRRPGSLAALLR